MYEVVLSGVLMLVSSMNRWYWREMSVELHGVLALAGLVVGPGSDGLGRAVVEAAVLSWMGFLAVGVWKDQAG